jgi:two-component system LytT family response regulator
MNIKSASPSQLEISCLIIDDEKLARDLVAEYLEHFPQIKILDQCSKGSEAVNKINTLRPDLIFLDIEMPGLNGLQVLENLTFRPIIVFVTAYDSYAVKAFEENASDYLLKPLKLDRFKITIERIVKLFTEEADTSRFENYSTFLLAQKSGKLVKVEVNEIISLHACKDYTLLYTEKEQYLSTLGIGKLTEKLNPEKFIRIHRSSIINVDYIQEIFKESGVYTIWLINNTKFSVGRLYLPNIRSRII